MIFRIRRINKNYGRAGLGWVDVDPTNGKLADTEFVTLAWGREYGDVAPLRGVVRGGGEHVLSVAVTVDPLE